MIGITYILLAVIVLVVLIDLYLKRRNKLAITKDIEKVVDKEHPEKKEYNKPVVIVTATLLLLIGLFFGVNHLKYDGRLTDTDDGISLLQNITLDKIKYADIVNNGGQWLNISTMKPISGIIADDILDGVILNGLKQGKFRHWHENGQLKIEGIYKNGIEEGLFRGWYENGQLEEEVNFKNGKLNGLARDWYENGELEKEVMYDNGIENGIEKSWYENGQLAYEINRIQIYSGEEYPMKGLHGINRAWHRNGKLMYEINWGTGLKQTPDGLARRFYSNGQLWAQATYKDGKLNGLARVWNKNGELEKEVSYIDVEDYFIRVYDNEGKW